MFKTKELIDFIQKAMSKQKDIVYINVLETQGTAYRNTGETMIVNSDGTSTGTVNEGFFEIDIINYAKDILNKNVGKYLLYDSLIKQNESSQEKHNIQSNGLIKLWMEPFYYKDNYGSLGLSLQYALNGEKKTLIRSIDNSRKYSFMNTSYKKENYYDESNNIFLQNIHSPFKLLLLGVGAESEPLLNIANTLGWHTSIYDTKKTILTKTSSADEKKYLSLASDIKKIDINTFNAAVVMSHDINENKLYIKELLFSKIPYIGIVGNQEKNRIILESIPNIKKVKSLNSRLHNPIGLNLGGDDPQSIALSICAEIQSKRNKTTPISLKNT